MSDITEDARMAQRTLLARDVFPGWLSTGPWPYEIGLAGLTIWFMDCLRVAEELLPRYADSAFFGWALTHGRIPVGMLLFITTILLLIGLMLLVHEKREAARPFRAAGVLLCCLWFAIMAGAFFWTFDHSIAGAFALFMAWRSFCVGVRLAVERPADAVHFA